MTLYFDTREGIFVVVRHKNILHIVSQKGTELELGGSLYYCAIFKLIQHKENTLKVMILRKLD